MRPTLRGDRWRARPVAATGLRLLTILLPVAAAFGATAAVRPFLPSPHGWVRDVAWWGILVFVATGMAMAVDRLGRRLVPLIMLLKLSMLFPDRAPSRFAVARHAGSVQKLRARLAEIQTDPQAATESASAATILALAAALQSHDRKTRGHAERVRVYTDLLAEELDLSRDDRYRLRWAALLHDIGKLTVNARILNKPGKLNEREWDVIRKHPAEGARIATPLLEWLGPWADAIEQHHERFGGGGYPAGIEGEEISLAGRIVAVSDCYDTMTAARTYKKPMAVRAAREELARCSPSQFDPAMVRAFLSISLPRLMWKAGPLSFLVTVPYLAALQQVGQQGLVAARGMTAAAAVAGAVTAHSSAARPHVPAHGLPTEAAISTPARPDSHAPASEPSGLVTVAGSTKSSQPTAAPRAKQPKPGASSNVQVPKKLKKKAAAPSGAKSSGSAKRGRAGGSLRRSGYRAQPGA